MKLFSFSNDSFIDLGYLLSHSPQPLYAKSPSKTWFYAKCLQIFIILSHAFYAQM